MSDPVTVEVVYETGRMPQPGVLRLTLHGVTPEEAREMALPYVPDHATVEDVRVWRGFIADRPDGDGGRGFVDGAR